MGSRRKARILALQALFSWDYTAKSSAELGRFEWLDEERLANFEDDTLMFARLIVQGTLENIEEIDTKITEQLEHWDFSRLARVDLAILRFSIYALVYQKEIPSSVTIDEAIDIAKHYGSVDSYRFINGVLDGIRKQLTEK
ncbi:MAG: transcription antitermination factor NusB [Spirochaetaceae bacterium]|nr:transcription antitermination factor NusB [Spirochaetaceae bacterium]MCF7949063.1 transcription antitermination factor NusB [Spirochaetia bacterium]MCF7950419.1 transcription antitermination factor NusB [Spirochaetaceae bacterium]